MQNKLQKVAGKLLLILVVMALAYLIIYVPQMTAVHK